VDQATATIIAAVISLSGTITAAFVALLWKSRAPQRHVYEYRILHRLEDDREPWLHGSSRLPTLIRGVGWATSTVLMFVGMNSLFLLGSLWWLAPPEIVNRGLKIWALSSTAGLALLAGYSIAKRIELPRETEDADDDDDDE
jgi:hypothetical protein